MALSPSLSSQKQRKMEKKKRCPFASAELWCWVAHSQTSVCKKLMAGARAACRSPESQPNICTTTQTPLMRWGYSQLCSPGEVSAQRHFFPNECFKKQSSLSLTDSSLCQTVFNGSPHILGYLHFSTCLGNIFLEVCGAIQQR